LKPLKENIGKTLEGKCIGNNFLNRTLIVQEIRARSGKWGCIKFKKKKKTSA
jgi:hypothetical protein